MKKIFLLIFLTVAMQQLLAQSVKFGIKAGFNEATADIGQSISTTSNIAGFNAGVFAEIPLNKFSVETGLFYTAKGYHTHTSIYENLPEPYNFNADGQVALKYLEVPVNIHYHISLGTCKIFIGGGPYFGLGLSGTRRGITTVNGAITNNQSNKVSFGSPGDFSKTDLGLNALTGVSLNNGLLFSVDYGYGLRNIYNVNNSKIKNRVLELSVGYEFL